MQKLLPLLIFFICFNSFAQQEDLSLDYYLPQDVSYNEKIPKPQEVIGYIPGEWHVTHDLLLNYMRELARVSPRISIENRGETYEGRPLILLKITSEENHNNLEEIRQNHLALTRENASSLNTKEMAIVVNQGFSIHGNEASGSNAALLVAYHLAAAEGEEIEELLDNTVILFDPVFNPDGLQRFSYWANTNKSENINPDPQDREYDEVWPGGRTNHYWFDMNRDWLPVQLPESQARIETFHKWMPNILTDHHEMGSNSSFFFQPGIPSRTHPLTPDINQELTKEIGAYHAAAFDELGSFYYTEENYDDFYYGKGSTFPDINGSIGILFEQGSSRGHAQETENGVLTFPFTIRNQFTAALSTLEAAKNMREKILNYQRDFYKNARNSAEKGAYVFGSEKDASSAYELAKILEKHKIELHKIEENFTTNGKNFKKNSAYVVPKNQRQHRLVKAMFERRTEFEDSLFYDISAWTLPLAFNLDFAEDVKMNKAGQKIENLEKPEVQPLEKSTYAYIMQWHDFYSPKALNMVLEEGLRAKVGMQPFSLENKEYDYGTILIPVQNQELDADKMYQFLQEVSKKSNVQIEGINTGLTQGVNLGSNQFRALQPAKVALIVGEGITPYDAGEIWHLFDQRYDMKITKLDTRRFSRTDLSRYTDIILPNSWGSALDDGDIEKLKEWIQDGGTLIGYRNAARFFEREDFMDLEIKKDSLVAEDISFEEQRDFRGAQGIGGAIFEANIDRSHPVNFGYTNNKLPLFRNTTIFIEADKQSYNNPIQYTENPLLSGYISVPRLDSIAGTVPFKITGMGRGNVILFTDNTNFRAFWFGTNKLLMNAIFFGDEM
ncbi:M14 family metallopeptidase [Salegentibacter salegens]|uniref:Zinc carboxypeptidase n=1 Tax=Salegentibacter salegens TaxID=143223 RepID=A0A1M7KMJ3_9FLAO|nr:M14 family metallopeptidase [Salegentibacter salegens]PRX48885.1 zinc carboxypeptidase [Salegentibacter salegens]SHM66652.1 Zinc carboxypeptidase [Salegentibacter salegens]